MILDLLSVGNTLFQSLIPLDGCKKECYGVSSDVCFDAVVYDIDLDETVISLVFATYETPCIVWATKVANRYNISVQLLFFNLDEDFSGKFSIHWHQIVINVRHSYWYGIYMYQEDLFWETIPDTLSLLDPKTVHFETYITAHGLNKMRYDDLSQLHKIFGEWAISSMFEKL